MKGETLLIAGRQCYAFGADRPQFLLIQPEGGREKDPEKQPELISSLSGTGFLHVSFTVENWNRDLSPWNAPPAFGEEGFGDGAADTLAFIMSELIPLARAKLGVEAEVPVVVGGYSLAALFAIWCTYRTDEFAAAAAASPSLWFPGWMEYAREHVPRTRCIYLSLGDREEKTKNRILASVGDNIREQYRLLTENGIKSSLVWNPGNHFTEPELRCAKAFAWCMAELKGADLWR